MSASPKRKTGTRKTAQHRDKTSARASSRPSIIREPVKFITLPGHITDQAMPLRRETISAFLRRTQWARYDRKYGWQFKNRLPTILIVNGEGLLRAEWKKRVIRAGDSVAFLSKPFGGGSRGSTAKSVGGLVALVAIAALALAAPYGAAALLPEAYAGFVGAGTLGGAALSGAIGCGGGLRVGALR
jgi:hypothetical protein